MIYVSWNQAADYCQWAGGDLPTEAQWEKAARGTDGRTYPRGNNVPNTNSVNYYNDGGDITAVGSFLDGASPFGALDMAGNVWEWVLDNYGTYKPGDTNNPTGPTKGNTKVVRGGVWSLNATANVRSSYRNNLHPSYPSVNIGFRCVFLP